MAKISQTQEVIKVMESNGGYSTLMNLYQAVDFTLWKTKTPDATIRRIVQDQRHFFKIRPGLWALKEFRNKLPKDVLNLIDDGNQTVDSILDIHSYNQGVLISSGNLMGFKTYVPAQDKNRKYLGEYLGNIATLSSIPLFTYEAILKRIRTIDVIWFENNVLTPFPNKVFEVENSTDFIKSFNKFNELKYFAVEKIIVAPDYKKKQFEDTINWDIYKELKQSVKFWDYDVLEQSYVYYAKSKFNSLFY
ncbi:hypothetical protein AV545_03630 [Paenibacillus jamilae]|uniref:hypothetical protein n=1 Tax=Paenibacillus jamilae TaxID=114136 RepID=UPI0007AB8C61|nr:hypothetical protein [Paenibacillus jamilae]KZE65022.1 hypothetical protein AV545_03630 [Paenibacillus jamilae]